MKRHRVQTSSFSLQRHNQGKVQVISVSGYLGDDEFPRLEKELEHLWQQQHWHLILDCTALSFIASVNLARLSLAAQFLRKHQGKFRLVGLPTPHRTLAQALGFDPHVELQPNLSAALKSIESVPGRKRKRRNKS
jgi:anti-anti-sigma factor